MKESRYYTNIVDIDDYDVDVVVVQEEYISEDDVNSIICQQC